MKNKLSEGKSLTLFREEGKRVASKLSKLEEDLEKKRRSIRSEEKAIEKERKKLAEEAAALEIFNNELIKKQELFDDRRKSSKKAISEIKTRERELRKNLTKVLGELTEVNEKLLASERRLKETADTRKAHEQAISFRKSELAKINEELGHLRHIKEQVAIEVLNLQNIDAVIRRIENLLTIGDIDRAIKTYESLRVTYSDLGEEAKTHLHRRLLELHKRITEQANKR
ncbi:hypothetical protein JXB11_03065 [Candidatus Woesearchaeota archaeon]|nr:hypothetical protein [Candidatus Woesearchaeota archaeon]